MSSKLKIGFCPIGKIVFSHEEALKVKKLIEAKFSKWNINTVSIDAVVENGIVRAPSDIDKVVKELKRHEIDGLFIPHVNFGTEGAAGMIAKKLEVPTLLWGPRDEAPLKDGSRLRDTLCGLFATSKVLHKLNVPFTYIENCRVDEPSFEAGVKNFQKVVSIVKKFRNMRIGQVGNRIDFFWSTIINESELLEKFGIEILPIDIVKFIDDVKINASKHKDKYTKELRAAKEDIRFEGFRDESVLLNLFAMRDLMIEMAEVEGISCYSIQTSMAICEALGCNNLYAVSMVNDARIPTVVESDIHGAISSVILQTASLNEDITFIADLTIRHPDDDNGVLLWHCECPYSLKAKESEAEVGPHWIFPDLPSGNCHWRLKSGDMTVLRFDGDGGKYSIICGEGKTTEGPITQNTYVWMKVKDWKKWEKKFIEGPYMHHVACNYGKHLPVIAEAIKYLPGNINFELTDGSIEEIKEDFFKKG